MPFIENFAEFKARQNCDCIQTKSNDFEDRWLFANGAGCILQKLGLQSTLLIREPPQDRWELLHAKREFLLAKISRESQAYQAALRECKQDAINAAQYPESCPPVPKAVLNNFRSWWDIREKMRAEMEQIDNELAESPAAVMSRQRRQLLERDSANRLDRQRTATLLNGIPSTGEPPTADIVQTLDEYFQS